MVHVTNDGKKFHFWMCLLDKTAEMFLFTLCNFSVCVLRTQGLGRLSQYAIAHPVYCTIAHAVYFTIVHPVYCTVVHPSSVLHNCTIAHAVYCTIAHIVYCVLCIAQLHIGRWQCPNDKCRELTVQLFGRGHHTPPTAASTINTASCTV